MVKNNVIRLMEEKDLFSVPDARESFENHGYCGDYFFFVIENQIGDVIGFIVAKKEDEKAIIQKLQMEKEIQDKELYQNLAISNLYEYVKNIRDCDGKQILLHVSTN